MVLGARTCGKDEDKWNMHLHWKKGWQKSSKNSITLETIPWVYPILHANCNKSLNREIKDYSTRYMKLLIMNIYLGTHHSQILNLMFAIVIPWQWNLTLLIFSIFNNAIMLSTFLWLDLKRHWFIPRTVLRSVEPYKVMQNSSSVGLTDNCINISKVNISCT